MTRDTTPTPDDPADQVAAILRDRYGLAPSGLARLPIGQGTINFRVRCPDREVFLKAYPSSADLTAERHAIDLSDLAGRGGVPTASAVPNRAGDLLDVGGPIAVSAWEWIFGQTPTGPMSSDQTRAAGAALGRIHQVFATLPASASSAPQANAWLEIDLPALHAAIDRLLEFVDQRFADGCVDAFDQQARRTLTERRRMLGHLPGLLSGLPKLSTQVLHGDYSPVNLLFDGDRLAAVTDFRPPDPFLVAFEIGRVAFYPTTVATTTTWRASARTLIGAYLNANPTVAADDIHAAARIALIQLLRSLYGVKQHYLKPGLFQDDLDTFWLRRHEAAGILLEHLADTDTLLHDLA